MTEKIEGREKCGLCWQPLGTNGPEATLHCGHTFCKLCLEGLVTGPNGARCGYSHCHAEISFLDQLNICGGYKTAKVYFSKIIRIAMETILQWVFVMTLFPLLIAKTIHDQLYELAGRFVPFYLVAVVVDLVLILPCALIAIIAAVEYVVFDYALSFVGSSLNY